MIATSIAAIVLATSLIAGASLAAAQAASVSAGTGQGAIVYHAHRIASPDWAPCFATTCDAGTGPGAAMYFVVYNSTGAMVADGFADETGTQITGLTIGSTYYIYPTDCNLCHNSTHNVVFDHWGDGSTDRPKAFVVTATPISADAYYRIVELGSSATTTTSSPPSSSNQSATPTPTQTTNPSSMPTSAATPTSTSTSSTSSQQTSQTSTTSTSTGSSITITHTANSELPPSLILSVLNAREATALQKVNEREQKATEKINDMLEKIKEREINAEQKLDKMLENRADQEQKQLLQLGDEHQENDNNDGEGADN